VVRNSDKKTKKNIQYEKKYAHEPEKPCVEEHKEANAYRTHTVEMMDLIWKLSIRELSWELGLVMDPILEADFLRNATNGFNKLFENDIVGARAIFNGRNDPFHQLGLGICAFLEAALGMEVSLPFIILAHSFPDLVYRQMLSRRLTAA